MKMQARMILETMEQVVATVEFARTMDIDIEMGGLVEPKGSHRQETIQLGVKEPPKTDQKLYSQAVKILGSGPQVRIDFVRSLAKASRKEVKSVGVTVKRWLKDGVLVRFPENS